MEPNTAHAIGFPQSTLISIKHISAKKFRIDLLDRRAIPY